MLAVGKATSWPYLDEGILLFLKASIVIIKDLLDFANPRILAPFSSFHFDFNLVFTDCALLFFEISMTGYTFSFFVASFYCNEIADWEW